MYRELDLVVLKHDVNDYGLKAGDVGTIVHCYPDSAAFEQNAKPLNVKYDAEQDVLYLLFTEHAEEAIAEEAGDEVFVRFDPDTRQIITIEFLNFRDRLVDTFGPEMKYFGPERPERLILPLGE